MATHLINPTGTDIVTDVVIAGSGAGGLTAAILAVDNGADVIVLEKTDKLGGSTALSAGAIWVPNNPLQGRAGIRDSREEAIKYLTKVSMGQSSQQAIEEYVDRSPEMIQYLQTKSHLKLILRTSFPDYHPEWEGGKKRGRSLEPEPFDGKTLGEELLPKIRRNIAYPPVTSTEAETWGPVKNWDLGIIEERLNNSVLTMGAALVGALVRSCADRGVKFMLGARAKQLIVKERGVKGLTVEHEGRVFNMSARRAVVLACGGFSWNEELKKHFLRGPSLTTAASPGDDGDGIVMGVEVGAKLLNMNEAWWFPLLRVPGEEVDRKPVARLVVGERASPGSIMVNKAGKRFCNEAHNYHDIGKAFHTFDPYTYGYPNIPAYLIFDESFRMKYSIGPLIPGVEVPDWVKKGETAGELAPQLGIDPDGLELTIISFNRHAKLGVDPEFHRGESAYDAAEGDRTAEHPCLAPIETPPFYGFEIVPGDIGTKGGLATNEEAQVVDVWGHPILGLYATGNVTASVMGAGYAGGGATLGPTMTFGYVAGINAARESSSQVF